MALTSPLHASRCDISIGFFGLEKKTSLWLIAEAIIKPLKFAP